VQSTRRKSMPDGMWRKCDVCGEILYTRELEKQMWVCSKCGNHFAISTLQYLDILCDAGSFEETHRGLVSGDPLGFKDLKKYRDRTREYRKKTGRDDAVITGLARIGEHDVVLALMDFEYMGGSMGSVVGEKIARAVGDALRLRRPLIILSRSGGARMQESIYSLMQMAKTASMLERLASARVPFVSLLTHPTTGGVTASFASLGDVIIAEPRALIGFAGARVIEQTIRQELPEGFQRSEFLLEHGMIDMICPRAGLRETLNTVLSFLCAGAVALAHDEGQNDSQSPAVS